MRNPPARPACRGAGRPALSVRPGSELNLPLSALLELMRAVLARGRPFRFQARGWSMSPFIRDRDVITIAPLGSAPPRTGDVVAFVSPADERLVVHRVVGRRGTSMLIQGDNLPGAPDGLIPLASVVGRVRKVERGGRPVRLGLGGERRAVALLSRKGLLTPLLTKARALVRRLAE
ncbi:MAG: S26 family signal peptidase [bacterium]